MTSTISKKQNLFTSIISTIGIAIFAWFVHAPFPILIFAFAGIGIPVWIIVRKISSKSETSSIKTILGFFFQRSTWKYVLIAIQLGVLISLVYKWHLGGTIWPKPITGFAIIAACIGASEELVFRGFLQGQIKPLNSALSVFWGSATHTLYKALIFLSPFVSGQINISFLIIWTFAVGLLLGWLKDISNSVFPPLIAHALFDIWVYGHLSVAPWWVW